MDHDGEIQILHLTKQQVAESSGRWLPLKGTELVEVPNAGTADTLELVHFVNVEHRKRLDDFRGLYEYYNAHPRGTRSSIVVYALKAGIYTEDVISEALLLLEDKRFSTSQTRLAFGKLVRVLGPDARLEAVANTLFARNSDYSASFLMTLAAFFNESGDQSRAIAAARDAQEREPGIWERTRFLGLSHMLFHEGHTLDSWAQADSRRFTALREAQNRFLKYVLAHKLTIVGNAPSEIGRGSGPLIDKGESVVRFNSANLDWVHQNDYGTRIDVLVLNPRYYETSRCTRNGLDYMIVADGNEYSSANLGPKLHDLDGLCGDLLLFPRALDIELTQVLAASPSSGMKLLYWLYKVRGPVPLDSTFGFSFADQGYGVSTSYNAGRRVGLSTIHNWEAERKLFTEIAGGARAEHE